MLARENLGIAHDGIPAGARAQTKAETMHSQEQIANNPEKDYLERVTRETGLSLSEIARRAKLATTTLTRFMSADDDKKRSLRRSTLRAIEQVTRIPLPPELAAAARGMEPSEEAQLDERPATVPLFALYGAPDHNDFLRNDQTDIAPRLPGIAHNMRVYAVRMPDASMQPWRQANELIYIDPTRFAAPGDHALVELAHPRDPNHPRSVFRIRRIVARNRDGGLRLAAHDGSDTETVPRERVLGAHRALEWTEVSIG
jgi:transcriptional regulator with XRE-family HTH domain